MDLKQACPRRGSRCRLAVVGSVPTLPHFLDDERIEDAIDYSRPIELTKRPGEL
jgi:hypothetical protein